MLLTGYTMEIFRSKCNAGARTLHCFAHLHDDVSEVLPNLNTIHARKIAVNALQDEEQAEKIVAWLQREINSTWESREEIEPSVESARQPAMMEVLKLLPRTNCKECGEPTCMVFAVRVIEGAKDQSNCPPLQEDKREELKNYLSQFHFE